MEALEERLRDTPEERIGSPKTVSSDGVSNTRKSADPSYQHFNEDAQSGSSRGTRSASLNPEPVIAFGGSDDSVDGMAAVALDDDNSGSDCYFGISECLSM